MEPVVALANKYRGEFESTIGSLRQRTTALGADARELTQTAKSQLQQLQTTVHPQLRAKQAAVRDLAPLPSSVDYGFILETYAWSTVLLIGLRVGQLFGAFIVGPLLLGPLFNTQTLAALTYLFLPAYFYLYNRKRADLTETDRRMLLLALALVVGLTSGYLLRDRVLPIAAPPAFLLPLVVGIGAQVIGRRVGNDRRLFLLATMGVGAAAYVLYGAITSELSVTYLLMVAITVTAGTVDVQLMIADAAAGRADMIASQLTGLLLTLYTQLLLTGVFSVSKYVDDGGGGGGILPNLESLLPTL